MHSCSSAPALVSAASPWGAETDLSPSHQTFYLDLRCKFFWYEDTRQQYALQCTAWVCILCVSRTQTISYSFYSSHPHVFSFSISLCSLCFPPVDPFCMLAGVFVSLAVILLCLYPSNKTCPLSYITHAHLFIQSPMAIGNIPAGYQKISICYRPTVRHALLSFLLVWIPLVTLWWIKWKLYDVK